MENEEKKAHSYYLDPFFDELRSDFCRKLDYCMKEITKSLSTNATISSREKRESAGWSVAYHLQQLSEFLNNSATKVEALRLFLLENYK